MEKRIELKGITSHAAVTYHELGLFNDELVASGLHPTTGCSSAIVSKLDLRDRQCAFTLYVVHLKSMGGPRDGVDGRHVTMPVRRAETLAVRRIIENRFGSGGTASKNFAICGDMNDYQERVDVIGSRRTGYRFETPARGGQRAGCLQ